MVESNQNYNNDGIFSITKQPIRVFVDLKNKPLHQKTINYVYSLQPIYLFLRTFGLLPFSIVRDINGELHARVRVFDIIWFVISICIYIFMAVFCWRAEDHYDTPNKSDTLFFVDAVLLTSFLITNILAIILDMYNRSKLIAILNWLTQFDNEVRF